MFNVLNDNTICAISTPPGSGGIAVIRVSGPDALGICDKLFIAGRVLAFSDINNPENNHKKRLLQQPANTIVYGSICCNDEVLDDVLISVFRAPQIGRASCRERV